MPPKTKQAPKHNILPPECTWPEMDDCPVCEGRGFIFDEKGDIYVAPCQKMIEIEERLEAARIPGRFAEKELESFEPYSKECKKILATARAYVEAFDPQKTGGLRMMGVVGCGKTHIAVGILKALIRKDHKGLFINLPELFNRLIETYNREASNTEQEILREVMDAEILVLDEVGSRPPTDWIRDRLYLIINHRYNEMLPTIITTNASSDSELQDLVGERIQSRLCEMCSRFPEYPGADYRRRALSQGR